MVYIVWLVAAQLAAGPERTFQNDAISIHVNVGSSIFAYRIANQGPDPVVGVDLAQHAAYNFVVPEGWDKQITEAQFRTWATDPGAAIGPGQERAFSMRVSSEGAVLGQAPAVVRLASGATLSVPGVWVPMGESKTYRLWVGAILLVIVLLAALGARRVRARGR